jgi:hypothetical protein
MWFYCLRGVINVGFWHWWQKKSSRTKIGNDEENLSFPESKGKITTEAIQDQLKEIDDAVIKGTKG